MLHKFFMAQWEHPVKNDWTETVRQDLDYLKLSAKLEDLKKIGKEKFKEMVKSSIKMAAFKYLMEQKSKLSKMSNLDYSELVRQDYLKTTMFHLTKRQGLSCIDYGWPE